MRRKVALALCAGALAAPIPVAALAQTGPDVGDVAAEAVMHKAELRKEARTAKRAAARRVAEKRQAKAAASVPVPPQLYEIAQCESGGDPRAIGGGGLYRGLLQFSIATWQSVGGVGDPIDASPAEQMRRGAILYARSGPSQWPVCGV
jgi:hypothetical protein